MMLIYFYLLAAAMFYTWLMETAEVDPEQVLAAAECKRNALYLCTPRL